MRVARDGATVLEMRAADMDHDDLAVEIQRLTGRWPVSKDPRYLRNRLASLRRRSKGGEDLVKPDSDTLITSVSMSRQAKDAIGRILDKRGIGMSALFRRAIAEWAARNSFRDEARIIDPGYST